MRSVFDAFLSRQINMPLTIHLYSYGQQIIQSNRSTTATLGAEESGRYGKVEVKNN